MTLPGMQDVKAKLPHGGQHPLDGLDGGAGQADVAALAVNESPSAAKVDLHVHHEECGVVSAQRPIVGPRIRLRWNKQFFHELRFLSPRVKPRIRAGSSSARHPPTWTRHKRGLWRPRTYPGAN